MDGKLHYRYTAQGQIESVMRAERLIARYRYNHAGQRVAKTTYAEGDSKGQTTWTLWQDGQRVAEINEAGQILAQYLYLHDKGRAIPIAKLQDGQIYYIHSDQRAAPLMMSDAKQVVVWRAEPDAWGWSPPHLTKGAKISLNLRLPGQYYDSETGLHDNWHRSYDPRPDSSWRGRYLSPDPLGYPDGPDPYAYGNGDPVNRIDPMGLYQSDIHYYMTFFLAVAAGMNTDDARVVALAAQWVDDNDDTRPLNVPDWPEEHMRRLLSYHFSLIPSEVDTDTGLLKSTWVWDYGRPDRNPNYENPESKQLDRLYGAALKKNEGCTKLQFLGEYLHTFEDTFSHRDRRNEPFDLNLGLGHGHEGSRPDYTYNKIYRTDHPNTDRQTEENWDVRENRTLRMEEEVLSTLTKWAVKTEKSITPKSWADIKSTMEAFNRIEEHEGNGYDPVKEEVRKKSNKLKLLQETLGNWGVTVEWLGAEALLAYSENDGGKNRNKYLCDLDQKDYPGTILPKIACPTKEK